MSVEVSMASDGVEEDDKYYLAFAKAYRRFATEGHSFDGPAALQEELRLVADIKTDTAADAVASSPEVLVEDSEMVDVVGRDGSVTNFLKRLLLKHPETLFGAVLESDSTAAEIKVDLDRTQIALVTSHFRGSSQSIVSAYEDSVGKAFNYANIPTHDIVEMEVQLALHLLRKSAKGLSAKRLHYLFKEIEQAVSEIKSSVAKTAAVDNAKMFRQNEGKEMEKLIPGLVVESIHSKRSFRDARGPLDDVPVAIFEVKLGINSLYKQLTESQEGKDVVFLRISHGAVGDTTSVVQFYKKKASEMAVLCDLLFSSSDLPVIESAETSWKCRHAISPSSERYGSRKLGWKKLEVWKKLCNPKRHSLLDYEDVFCTSSLSKVRERYAIPEDIEDGRILQWLFRLVLWATLPPLHFPISESESKIMFAKSSFSFGLYSA